MPGQLRSDKLEGHGKCAYTICPFGLSLQLLGSQKGTVSEDCLDQHLKLVAVPKYMLCGVAIRVFCITGHHLFPPL